MSEPELLRETGTGTILGGSRIGQDGGPRPGGKCALHYDVNIGGEGIRQETRKRRHRRKKKKIQLEKKERESPESFYCSRGITVIGVNVLGGNSGRGKVLVINGLLKIEALENLVVTEQIGLQPRLPANPIRV